VRSTHQPNDDGAPKAGNPQPTKGWAELTPWNAPYDIALLIWKWNKTGDTGEAA